MSAQRGRETVWPWQWTKRFRPWSLIEMLRLLHVGDLSTFMVNFERSCAFAYMLLDTPPQEADQRR